MPATNKRGTGVELHQVLRVSSPNAVSNLFVSQVALDSYHSIHTLLDYQVCGRLFLVGERQRKMVISNIEWDRLKECEYAGKVKRIYEEVTEDERTDS